ncbi:MAG: deoxyribodipyrimidine photo-lyase/cryptochrome family protein [Marinobacter sp.]|nr:deoxyribodipyrimidine photo-lyase/cryptochrome family protein [Marinobacter sp.]
MQIFWLKRNLRLQDSVPFFLSMKASRSYGKVLPLYVHEPGLIAQPDVSRQHQAFISETLVELSTEFEALGGQLLQAIGETVSVLERIHRCSPITRICTHCETTQNAQYERDIAVRAWCREKEIELMEVEQNGVARGKQSLEAFAEYFSRAIGNSLKDPTGADLSQRFARLPFTSCAISDIPLAAGADKPGRQRGGRQAGQDILNNFFNVRNLSRYPSRISSPNTAWASCSRVSTYLAYGIVSDREVFQAVDRVVSIGHGTLTAPEFARLQNRARFFLDRLNWRRQYLQVFESHPHVETRCMLPQFDGVREAEFDEGLFLAWSTGRTGIPYIDAAMRCLRDCGWINMRLRATLVSFATMNCWLPTHRVAQLLATEFLDYEPGIHHVIHQIVSGTSDFQALMIYDPMKQARDHDPQGQFIRRWVPELADLSGAEVHELARTAGCHSRIAEDLGHGPYPAPVVDCKLTAKSAKSRIHALKNGFPDPGRDSGGANTSSPQLGLI